MPVAAAEKHGNVSYFNVASPDALTRPLDNGTAVVEGIRIFRAGSFRDSMGEQHSWSQAHLEQMVFHFQMLRADGTFPHVPVRHGHPGLFGSGGEVVGYISALRRDGDFLVADLELTEPDAVARWQRGTYRARSLEVGMYETNDEAAYWPVVMGLAFVDIPAVEGLYAKARQTNTPVVTLDSEEIPVPTKNHEKPKDDQEAPAAEAPDQPSNPQEAPVEPAAGEQPQVEVEAEQVVVNEASGEEDSEEEGDPTEPTAGNHSRNAAWSSTTHTSNSAHQFRINGTPTMDFAAVQAHIESLEAFANETREANRKAFVEGLAAAHKIAATQVESLTAHALSLSDEQYAHFTAAYEAAPSLSLFGQHAGGVSNPDGQPSTTDDEIQVLEDTVAMHRRSGMTEEQLSKTPSFKRLAALKAQPTA